MNKDYIDVVYDETEKPFTEYPDLLAKYLVKRFGLSSESHLLEVGCGRGEFLRGFFRCGLHCYGVDQSEMARKICPEAEIELADLEKGLPYPDNRFDVVYSKSVVEHFYYPERLISEMCRVLKPNGILITLTPAWEYVCKTFYDDYTHRTPFTRESLKNIQRIQNFQNVQVEYFYQLPILWRNPRLNFIYKTIGALTPWSLRKKTKFLRFSKEVVLLASAVKLG